MSRRPKNTPSEDPERKIEIYHKAAQIFHDKGFDASSMSDIAEAMNLTKAGLYYYINSKEELLFNIMEYAMDMLQEMVIDPARAIDDPERRLASIIENHAMLVMGDIKVITILTDEMAGLSPAHHQHIIQRKQEYLYLLRSTLQALTAAGKTKPLDPTVVSFSIFGMLLWLPRWFNPSGSLSRDEVIQNLKKLIYGGVGQTPAFMERAAVRFSPPHKAP